MPVLRKCIVSVTDADGTRHSVEVSAETLFEAAALALNAFAGEEWVGVLRQDASIQIEVLPVPKVRHVSLRAVTRWAQGSATSPREKVIKDKLAGLTIG